MRFILQFYLHGVSDLQHYYGFGGCHCRSNVIINEYTVHRLTFSSYSEAIVSTYEYNMMTRYGKLKLCFNTTTFCCCTYVS
ncbi:hypothetical protein GDO81_005572 [Engystomops pustulosus]|uniref:Uncharacterized protein n=1 Tax=Engystomops pustulosus TaxID=76066 RepID=A0AAV7CPY3_ENGPU|nr:hypothetical protein GDO81_005572 [Engystomops pustulosus]